MLMALPCKVAAESTPTIYAKLVKNSANDYTLKFMSTTDPDTLKYVTSGAGDYDLSSIARVNATASITDGRPKSWPNASYIKSVEFVAPAEGEKLKPTSMFGWFYGLTKVTADNIKGTGNLDTSGVTDMSYLFSDFKPGTEYNTYTLDLSWLDMSSVTNARSMFSRCQYLTNINNLDFSKAQFVDVDSMFYDCQRLNSEGLGLTNWNTSNVTNMSYMFYNCKATTELNVSRFDTKNVTNIINMFSNCASLTSLDISTFDISKIKSLAGLFNGCSSLTSLKWGNWDTSNITDMSSLFSGCKSLTTLDISKLKTTSVTNMNNMFSGLEGLTSLDISGLNTDKVTDMTGMFNGCKNLTSLDVSKLNTENVTKMGSMFGSCQKLTHLDVSKFNTSKVTDMNHMFYECWALEDPLDVSGFNTGDVISFDNMFSYCSKLTAIDVSEFDTSNATNMTYMFNQCKALKTVDLTNFNTSKVTNMSLMFSGCTSINNLNFKSFDTSNCETLQYMFQDCTSLDSLDLSSFNTSKASTMQSMFYGCTALKYLDISNFTSQTVVFASNFANGCSALKELKTGFFNFTGTGSDYGNNVRSSSNINNIYTGVGSTKAPCHMTRTKATNSPVKLPRQFLGTAVRNHATLGDDIPPYYNYCGGVFTIADTLDTSKDYTPKADDDTDLWFRHRTLKANAWSSIVLPAGITQEELSNALGTGVEIDYLDKYDGDTLRFKTLTGTTVANTPYIVKPASDVGTTSFIAVDIQTPATTASTTNGNMAASASGTGKISKTTETATFFGNYNLHNTLTKGYFVLTGGKIKRSTGTAYVDPTRCYFQFSDINENTTAYKAKYVAFDSSDDFGNPTTSIARIEADGTFTNADKAAYNLAGQRVGNDYKGIVIIGGKKILRR